MTCFFSGTDISELHDNAGSHNYYLSLIVNHKSQYCAKIAFVAERTIKSSQEADFLQFKGTDGEVTQIDLQSNDKKDKVEKVLVILDCEIIFEQDEFLEKRIQDLKDAKKPKSYVNQNYVNVAQSAPIGFKSKTIAGWNMMTKKQKKAYLKSGVQTSILDDQYSDMGFNQEDWELGRELPYNPHVKSDYKAKYFDAYDIIAFLVKWLSRDNLCGDSLLQVIRQFSIASSIGHWKCKDMLDDLSREFDKYYSFQFHILESNINKVDREMLAEKCAIKLKDFSQFKICEDIIDILDDISNGVEKQTDEFAWNKLNAH